MNDKKEKTGFWQDWMTIVVLAALTIMVFIFNSQSPSIRPELNGSILTENSVLTEYSTGIIDNNTNISIEYGSGINITDGDNDTNFKNWMIVSFAVINEDLNCIVKSGKIRNFDDTEKCGRLLKENSDRSLKHINVYNVSTSLQAVLDEYKEALEDYYIGGVNLETGARDRNMSQMDQAIEYIQSGNIHINKVDSILSGNSYQNISNTTSKNTEQ